MNNNVDLNMPCSVFFMTLPQNIIQSCQTLLEKIQIVSQRIIGQQAARITTYSIVAIAICSTLYGIYKATMFFREFLNRETTENIQEKQNFKIVDNNQGIPQERQNVKSQSYKDFMEGEEHYNGDLSNLLCQNIVGLTPEGIEKYNSYQFKQSLEDWAQTEKKSHSENTTKIDEAVTKILNSFNDKSRTLDLSNADLHSLPRCLFQLTQLQELSLYGNELTTLSEDIGLLYNLKKLYLGRIIWGTPVGNKLSYLPETICKLSNLENLDVSFNNLSEIPKNIGKLSKLEFFSAIGNQITFIPDSLCSLYKLKTLYLGSNQITSLSNNIEFLTNLEKLSLTHNNFNEIPVTIGNLLKLKRLTIHDNKNLEELPLSLENLSELKHLECANTKVTEEQVSTILSCCKNNRENQDTNLVEKHEFLYNRFFKKKDHQNGCEVMIGIAKTISLRHLLQEKIQEWETSNKKKFWESAITFLSYAVSLEKKLSLETSIENKSDLKIKHLEWINEQDLINGVNERYLETLLGIVTFRQLIEKETSFEKIWKSSKEYKEFENDEKILRTYIDTNKNDEEKRKWTNTAIKYYAEAFNDEDSYNQALQNLINERLKHQKPLMKEWINSVTSQ